MDMDRIMPVTLWSTLGGGDEVDMLEDIDGKERRRWWSAQHHLTVMQRQRQQVIGARKAGVEEDWKRLRMG